MSLLDQLKQGKMYLDDFGYKPKTAVILHSSYQDCISLLSDQIHIESQNIPGFPEIDTNQSKPKFIFGRLDGKDFIFLTPGLLYYEGYHMWDLAFPIRLMKSIGVQNLILTDHGVSVETKPHDSKLFLISDHINLMGTNPLIGPNERTLGPRFPDMTYAYSQNLRSIGHEIGKKNGIDLSEGIYAAVTGPQLSSKSELGLMKIVGAQMAGFTICPEVITAVHSQLSCLGIVSAHHYEKWELSGSDNKKISGFIMALLAEI